jgi:hypothetical protein
MLSAPLVFVILLADHRYSGCILSDPIVRSELSQLQLKSHFLQCLITYTVNIVTINIHFK